MTITSRFLLFTFALILFACKTDTQTTELEGANEENSEKTQQEAFDLAVSRLSGSNWIILTKLEDSTATITFPINYKNFKIFKLGSSLTEKDYKSYWSNGSANEKILAGSGPRLLSKLPFLETVKVQVALEEVVVDRSELLNWLSVTDDDLVDNFTKVFADPVIYDDERRKQFIDHFSIN